MTLVPRVLLVLPVQKVTLVLPAHKAQLVLMEVTVKTERLVRRVLLEIQVAPLDQRVKQALKVLPAPLVLLALLALLVLLARLVLPVLTVFKV